MRRPTVFNLIVILSVLAIQFQDGPAQGKDVYVIPQPAIGWDSLYARIPYDELLRQAGVQGAYSIRLRIDSSGNVISKSISPLNSERRLSFSDSVSVSRIECGLKGVAWNPATHNGHPVSRTFFVPVVFYLTYDNVAPPIIKHAEIQHIASVGPGYLFR